MAKEGINIPVGIDTRGLQTGIEQAATILKDGGQKMADAVAATGEKSATGLKSLQQAYRATYKDAQLLAQMQGTNSAAFQEAAKKAAEYKDTLEDVQDAIKAASPEQRWKVVGQAIQGAAQVAQGFVGTMELIGVETKDAEKAIAQMMALQGISNAIGGIFQLKDAFVALNAATQASVIGIGLMAAAWVVYNLSTEDATAANKRFAESAKAIQEAEDKVQDTIYETSKLRIKAMKDGPEKERAIAESNYKHELFLLNRSLERKEIAEMTYQMRSGYLYQIYQNELTKIQQKGETQRSKPKKSNVKADFNTKEFRDGVEFGVSDISIAESDLSGLNSELDSTIGKYNDLANSIGNTAIIHEQAMDKIKIATIDLEVLIENALISTFDLLGETLANIFSGTVKSTTLIQSIGEILANFMRALGTAMIAAGVASDAFKVLFATGVPAIVAGGALIAGASLVSSLMKSGPGGSASSGGGSSYSTSSMGSGGYYGNNYQPDPIQVGGIVRGSDLQIVLINTNNQTRRIR